MVTTLKDKKIVVIGGSSGIGFQVAQKAVHQGATVTIGARNRTKLAQAAETLAHDTQALAVDTLDRSSIIAFFAKTGDFDHLFISAATYSVVSIENDDIEAAESPFKSKFWGQYRSVQQALPFISKEGSITLMSGAAGARPIKGAAAYAACNSAIEVLGRALAIDLAPVRVNTISPGTIDGHLWQNRPEAIKKAAFAHYSQVALVGRPGTEDEVADTVLFLMTNTFITGSTLYPDGGYTLR